MLLLSDPGGSRLMKYLRWSAFQRKLTILSTTIVIQAVHYYKSGNTIPENVSLSVPVFFYMLGGPTLFSIC